MLGGFRGSEIFTITKYRPISVLIRILAALGLALVVVGVNQLPLAHAASDNLTDVSFELQVNPAHPAPVCLHHSQKFYIFLTRHLSLPQYGIPDLPLEISGVVVRGSVADTNIGTLLPPDTSGSYELSDLSVGAADFAFIAKKVGTTILKFDAEVGSYWDGEGVAHTVSQPHPVHVEVPVKVIPCKFKVGATSRWHLPGPHQFDIVGMIDNAEMKADEQGNFTGSASMNWAVATTVLSPICLSAIFTVSPSQANLTGQMDDSGLLQANLTYSPATASMTQVCKVPTGTQTSTLHLQMVPDPLNLSVASSGGTFNKSQVLVVTATDYGGTAPLSGSSVIVVIPEQDEAVAFNSDSQAALFPSAWRAMLWDNFPWPHNASLALR